MLPPSSPINYPVRSYAALVWNDIRVRTGVRRLLLGLVVCCWPVSGFALPESSPMRDWNLVGTVVTSGDSKAIFADLDGVQRVVALSEQVGDCRLSSVAAKHVLLECSGMRSRKELVERVAVSDHEETTSKNATPSTYDRVVPYAKLRALLRNRQRLVSQISLEPAVKQGFVYGYRVTTLRTGSEAEDFGLVQGDVILAVNGSPARETGSFMQHLNLLAEARAITVELEREGRPLTFNYLLP